MKLLVGERLSASGPASQPGGYVVTGVVSETPWSGLYSGKKIFYNFDFTAKRPRETDDNEWLDVMLRTIQYPVLDDPGYVARRRSLARAEARLILGSRSSNLWPEPLDLLELPNTRDPFTFARDASSAAAREVGLDEPIVIFAHPHGQALSEWQEGVLPLASLLGVLAEILEFMRLAHDAGLVLNGLGPDSILMDRTSRVHYVGSDMVYADGDAAKLGREEWQRLYPPLRYARGFAAPECFDLNPVPDRRSDLYAWGALAYYLLTGERPGKIAQEQGQAWARFDNSHFSKLERSLRGVPPAHVRTWAEELGVAGQELVDGWPGNMVSAFRLLVHPDWRRRPASAAELRTWIASPPPPPVSAALAFRTAMGGAKIFVDLGEITPGFDLVVRRQANAAPLTSADGEPVHDGPPAVAVDDSVPSLSETYWYAIFTRHQRQGTSRFSIATTAELIEPNPAKVLRLVEHAAPTELDAAEPSRVNLLFQALDETKAAEILLGSRLPPVRAWAIRRLEKTHALTLPNPSWPGKAEALLWRALQDPYPPLRLQAARALLQDGQLPDEDLVRRMVSAMGGDDLDDRIQAAQALRQLGLDDKLIQRTVATLEGDRPTTCPVCQAELSGRDRPWHLRDVHGYVEVGGVLLPRPTALERLWDGVFDNGDVDAHERLLEIFASAADLGAADVAGTSVAQAHARTLEKEVDRRSVRRDGEDAGAAQPSLEQLVVCLRKSPRSDFLVPELLRSRVVRLREVGREVLLPQLAARLREDKPNASVLRRLLDQACPEDLLEEKILLCLRLPQLGADLATANACLAQLQEERPITCSECRARVKLIDLELHLRRAHGIFEFRGVRRSFMEMRGYLLAAVCGPSPDYAAWSVLESIARERYGDEAETRLVSWLGQELRSLEREHRLQAAKPLAEVIARSGCATRLVLLLVEPQRSAVSDAIRRMLALQIVLRLPAPHAASLVDRVKPLLGDKTLPRELRHGAVAALLRTTGDSGPAARALLTAFIAQSGKLRAIEKLQLLEKYVGQAPEIDSLCAELEDQVRMTCPRCATQLRRAQMVQHLWDRHRLVLEGRRVREPWRVIEDWLEDYRLERDAAVLERCRDLARKVDPAGGFRHVQRLLLRHGVEDRDALGALLNEARTNGTCVCPHCFTLISATEVVAPAPLEFSGNTLAGENYRVELFENGLVPYLEIEGPGGMIYGGREPGRLLTRNGGLALIVGPLVLASFLLTEFLTSRRLPLPLGVALAVGTGLFLGGLFYLFWPVSLNPRDRLLDWAWTILMPELNRDRLSVGGAAFVAGLAQVSSGLGTAESRAPALEVVRDTMEKLARHDAVFIPHLAHLWRLTAEDLAQREQDPIGLLAEQAGRCFTGRLPLFYATYLLQDLFEQPRRPEETYWWNKGQRKRLQIYLCDQAFAAGLELPDLLDVARANAALGSLLAVEEVDYLAQLRLLWSFRASRPWERHGGASTAFDVAAKPQLAGKLLARFPDLLLTVDNMSLFVCGRGVCFEDTWFFDMPASFEVRSHRKSGFELVIGPHHFRFADNPDSLAILIEKWFRYYFRDFRPQIPSVHEWRSPDVARKLQARNGVPCPECNKRVVTRPGDLGITLDEKVVATWI